MLYGFQAYFTGRDRHVLELALSSVVPGCAAGLVGGAKLSQNR